MFLATITLILFACVHLILAQLPGNTQITCLLSSKDSFCLTCDSTNVTCQTCATSYLKHDTTGLCGRIRVGDTTPSNMVNNVRTYSQNVSGQTVELLQTLDPYCVLPQNLNSSQAAQCGSCTAYPDKAITTTNTTGSGTGGGQGSNTTTTTESPRYLSVDTLSCHSHCNYATTGLFATSSQSVYKCSACVSTCIRCTSSSNCKECIYSKKRIQGTATISNFLTQSAAGTLACTTARTDNTKTLVYYVAPAGSAKRCTSGCSNSDDGTGILWDDLTMVFKDIIEQAASYTSVDVKIYLLKSGTNLIHYVLDRDTETNFYSYNYFTPSTSGHLPRPFERSLATVYIGPIYCSDRPTQTGCLSAGEKPTLKWKSSVTHFSVTKSFTIENVIIDGADMTPLNINNAYACMTQRKQCCSYDSTTGTVTQVQTPSSCTPTSSDYADWTINATTYETQFKAEKIYGVFVFEFIRDLANAPVPTLTINKCEIRNFFYSKYHSSFIQMSNMGGNLLIENSVFDRFFFPHGLISNSHTLLDRNLFGFSSFSDETCRSLQGLDSSVNCHNVTIVSSNFTNYNPQKTTNLQTNEVHSVEGAVLAVHNLDGPITIYDCIFKGMLAFNRYNNNQSRQHDCLAFEPNAWGSDVSSSQAIHNIVPSSNYKMFLDKHFRKYAENKLANTSITAAIHIRNVTKGLTIYKNTFNTIYTVVGGAIYVEGFNNTLKAPIIISSNTFTNNFAQFIGANLFIYKYGYNIPRLDCYGILVDSNTFTDNYGCLNTIGNVVLACEPNDYNGYSYPSNPGPTTFASYYETYSKTSNQAFLTDDYSYRNFTRFLDEISANRSTSYSYTHSVYTNLTFNPNQVVFSNNDLERNYMKLSNGFYIQGPLNLIVKGNTFKANSIPIPSIYSTSGFTSSAFKLTSRTTPTLMTDIYMVESVPLIIRQANYAEITDNVFDGNSQGFLGGDYHMAQSITMHQLIGKDKIVMSNNQFKNHVGMATADATSGYYAYASSPIIAFNFWELTSEYIKGLDENNDGVREYPSANSFSLEDSVFENNIFGFNASSDTKGIYYTNNAIRQNYLYPFAQILKYFNGEEVTSGSSSSSFTSPVSYSSGPPMTSLHVTVSGSNLTNNIFNNGYCAFSSFWFNQFNIEDVIFSDNAILQGSTNSGGYICAAKDQLMKNFNNGSTLTFSNIKFTDDNGTLLYLTSIENADPSSTQPYIINIDTITISGTRTDYLAPITASSSKKVGISSVTASSFFGSYGLLYLKSTSNIYANTITITDSTGDDTGLIYADTATFTEIHNLVCSDNKLQATTSNTTFDWSEIAISQNVSSVQALIKQTNGNLTLVDATISDSEVPLGFLSSDGYLNLYASEVFDISVDYNLFLAIGSTTLYFSNSSVHDITAGTSAFAGIIVSDSSKITTYNTSFYSVTAPTCGFLLCQLSTVTLTNSNISYIEVTGQNAVLSAKLGKMTVSGTYFGYNQAADQNIFSVTLGAISVTSSTFEKNKAAYMSSGIFVKKSVGVAKIASTTFQGRGILEADGVLSEFLVVYDSSVFLDGVKFNDAYASSGAMYIDAESYTVTLNDVQATNNYADENGVLTIWATLVIRNSVFTANQYSIYTEATNINITNTTFSEENLRSVTISCTSTSDSSILFNNVTFNGHPDHSIWDVTGDYSSLNNSAGVKLSGCSGVTIKDSLFKNLKHTSECGAGLYVYSESTSSAIYTIDISGTEFYNNLANQGGSICIQNLGNGLSKINAMDTIINYGRAVSAGAAIYYDNFKTSEKTVSYTAADGIDYLALSSNVTIKNSVAGEAGGGIYYTQLRPTSAGVTFSDNQASYGPNWASYPVSLTVITDPDSSIYSSSRLRMLQGSDSSSRILTSIVQDFVSGQQLDPPVVIGLVDIDGQIVGNWDSSTMSMTYSDSTLKASTTTTFQARNGYFVLDPLILSYTTGKSVSITLSTTIETLSSDILGLDESISLAITPYFRLCTVGERLTDANECELCPETKALFEVNSKEQCQDCPENMYCEGGPKVGPVLEYSRFSKWNDRAVACLNDEACLGYVVTESQAASLYCKDAYNSTFCYTGWCSERYTGNLCAQCTSGNAKSSEIYCVPCSDNPFYYVLAVFVIIAAIGFIVFTVRNALKIKDFAKKGGKPKTSILIKIFLNYVQLVSIVSSFDFRWPDEVQSMFTVQSKVSSSTSEVFSVDCFLPGSNTDSEYWRPFFVKLLFISLSPIFLIGVSALVWLVILKIPKVFDLPKFKTNLTTTCVVLLFMVHTTLVQTSILGFRCKNIGDSTGDLEEYYLERDLDVKCWEGAHLIWSLGVSLPAFIVWGIGIPLFAFRILKKNQKHHEQAEFKSKYGFLYDGYKKEKYFWEFIILYRKVIMIFISVFMVTYGVQIQALAVLGVSFLSYVLHMRGKPFQEDDLNSMERKALINATITLYCGIYYITDELPYAASLVLLIVIIVFNAIFFLSWFLTLIKEYKKQFTKKSSDKPANTQNTKPTAMQKLAACAASAGYLLSKCGNIFRSKKSQINFEKSNHIEVENVEIGEPSYPVSGFAGDDMSPPILGIQPDKEEINEL